MYCFFCSNNKINDWFTAINCNYIICYKCWDNMIPEYITNRRQKWEFIQMRGDKIKNEIL